ncbi:hypothetical protein BRD17_08810 [Halobacteriales archaeon SW_7_68_16]|nr:MAG: hypothetical protein BRD17_08810 [Halobacteriales archaeon SW_7_68_16]
MSVDGGGDPGATSIGGSRVDSNWWYLIAAVPVVSIVATALVAGAILSFFAGIAVLPVDPSGGGLSGIGLGLGVVGILLVVGLLLVSLVVTLLLPVALYYDIEAVTAADVGWDPDRELYLVLGILNIFVAQGLIGLVVSVYYLYQRHVHVGTP